MLLAGNQNSCEGKRCSSVSPQWDLFSHLYLRSRARRQEGHLNELHVAFTACERMCRPSILPQ